MSPLPAHDLGDLRLFVAYAVFFASYLVFALGKFPGLKIDRPGAGVIGAVRMVAFGVVEPAEALRDVDFGTIVLLFSMMLIVAYVHLAGLFEWITHVVVTRLKPQHLLRTVVFTSGVLSAFFVNDIICLVMVPFVLTATRRIGVRPVPYLLAVATASNIGSVATLTGNPQNMLIGSYSGIPYHDFLLHLGPIAIAGLLLDWALIHVLCLTGDAGDVAAELPDPVQALDRARLVKSSVVMAMVIAGFLAGLSPALVAAAGAAVMADHAHARTTAGLRGGRLGPARLLRRPLRHRRRGGARGTHGAPARGREPLEPPPRRRLHRRGRGALEPGE